MSDDSPPHSRWLIRESIDRLAVSHDAVSVTVEVLTRSAIVHSSASPGPTLPQRITGRRGWPRTVWFGVTTLLTGLLLVWISVRLVQHLSTAPNAVAILPGLLLTTALATSALLSAKHLERPLNTRPFPAARPWALLAAATVGSVAWIILWLVLTTDTAAWAAFTYGVALVASVVAGMLALAHPVRPALAATPRAPRLPRRLRAQRRRAQRRLRKHARDWNLTVHQYGVVMADSDATANALARLLADETDLPLEGIDPYNTLILNALRKYHPAPLTASFDAAVGHLNDFRHTAAQQLVGTP